MFNDPDLDLSATVDDFVELAGEPEPAKPERKGELAKLLKGTSLTPDWIDGYLTAIVIAPKLITPNRWLPILLEGAMGRLKPTNLQRFLDLVMMRANAAVRLAEDSAAFERYLGRSRHRTGPPASARAARPSSRPGPPSRPGPTIRRCINWWQGLRTQASRKAKSGFSASGSRRVMRRT